MQVNSINAVAFRGTIGIPCVQPSDYRVRDKIVDVSDISCIKDFGMKEETTILSLNNGDELISPLPISKILEAYNAAKDSDITISLNA